MKEKLTEEDTNLADDNSINSTDTIENALVSEIQKIQKVEIGVSDNKITENTQGEENKQNQNITKADINKVKKLLKKEYGVSEKCLKIS